MRNVLPERGKKGCCDSVYMYTYPARTQMSAYSKRSVLDTPWVADKNDNN